jgi:hypothetical protein
MPVTCMEWLIAGPLLDQAVNLVGLKDAMDDPDARIAIPPESCQKQLLTKSCGRAEFESYTGAFLT